MKRDIGMSLSVLLATIGLLIVPVGLVALVFNPVAGIVTIAVGGLMIGSGVVLDRKINRPQRRHHNQSAGSVCHQQRSLG
jgi:hypothetical protein